MSRQKAPTLEMVARHAGVSRATVSRVVNGQTTVDPKVAEVVRASVDALNYVPNRAARTLARHSSQAIAVVVPESAAKVFSDPFFSSVVQGVVLELAPTDYTMNLIIESEAHASRTQRYLLGGNVDGALVVSHHTGDHSWAELGSRLPVVFGGRPLTHDAGLAHYVDVDNAHGARVAVEHLVEKGRTRIGTIAGPQDMPPGVDRVNGWRDALAAEGLAPGPMAVGDFTADGGAAAMQAILSSGEEFDALFIANDQMAVGAYGVLREAGLSIPGDVSIVGYDDSYFAVSAAPPLSTVRQPMVDMGAEMARVLVRLIEGEEVERVTMLETRLVVRESS